MREKRNSTYFQWYVHEILGCHPKIGKQFSSFVDQIIGSMINLFFLTINLNLFLFASLDSFIESNKRYFCPRCYTFLSDTIFKFGDTTEILALVFKSAVIR